MVIAVVGQPAVRHPDSLMRSTALKSRHLYLILPTQARFQEIVRLNLTPHLFENGCAQTGKTRAGSSEIGELACRSSLADDQI